MGKMQAVQEMINVFVASVVSLAVLFILTRLGGKRQIAQMNLFDYVNSITIGSIAAEMATNLEQWYRHDRVWYRSFCGALRHLQKPERPPLVERTGHSTDGERNDL